MKLRDLQNCFVIYDNASMKYVTMGAVDALPYQVSDSPVDAHSYYDAATAIKQARAMLTNYHKRLGTQHIPDEYLAHGAPDLVIRELHLSTVGAVKVPQPKLAATGFIIEVNYERTYAFEVPRTDAMVGYVVKPTKDFRYLTSNKRKARIYKRESAAKAAATLWTTTYAIYNSHQAKSMKIIKVQVIPFEWSAS